MIWKFRIVECNDYYYIVAKRQSLFGSRWRIQNSDFESYIYIKNCLAYPNKSNISSFEYYWRKSTVISNYEKMLYYIEKNYIKNVVIKDKIDPYSEDLIVKVESLLNLSDL